ncbi:MAG: biopolymer transporter ExbD [Verrucomicrobiae bacterium]|nr:biopolymer transporter ExbD [Verrucomicrobiae bacterium]
MKLNLDEILGSSGDSEFQMAPMIDCVFLMMIYFLLTTELTRSEADLGIQLPGLVKQFQVVKMPDEQIIEITGAGLVILNGRTFDPPASRAMPQLVGTLVRFRQASQMANTRALITVQCADEAPHQRVMDVLNACAAAGITGVTFGMGEE